MFALLDLEFHRQRWTDRQRRNPEKNRQYLGAMRCFHKIGRPLQTHDQQPQWKLLATWRRLKPVNELKAII